MVEQDSPSHQFLSGTLIASQVAGLGQWGGSHLGCSWHWVLVVTDSDGGCTHRMCAYRCVHRANTGCMHTCIHAELSRTYMGMSVHTRMNPGLYPLSLGRCILVDTRMCGPSQAYTCKYTQLAEVYCAQATHLSVSSVLVCTECPQRTL